MCGLGGGQVEAEVSPSKHSRRSIAVQSRPSNQTLPITSAVAARSHFTLRAHVCRLAVHCRVLLKDSRRLGFQPRITHLG